MSAQFSAASSRYLLNSSPPITTYPITVGIWVRPTNTGTRKTVWDLHDTTLHSFRFGADSTNVWRLTAVAGGAGADADCGTVTANQWTFLVGRWISATNRRLSVLQYDGSIATAQNTTSTNPIGVTRMGVGVRLNSTPDNFMEGQIAEWWITNTDIQPDGAQLQNSTLRQLAYQGPFSLPHIAKDIIEYRSFRSRLDSRADTPDEVYNRGTPQVWTNTNGVTLGPHPPAADNYVSPLTEDAPMVLV